MTEERGLDLNGGVSDSPARLLVVDDNPKLLASLCPLLENKGFQVDAVQDGRTACRQASTQAYDLMLLDMNMPGMSGIQVMARLRKAGLDMPVVVVSGESTFKVVRKALREGAYDYIRKPYNVDDLVATVHSALHKRRLERAQATLQLYLRASEAFYRRAIDNLPDIVFALDQQGRFAFINHRVESLLGYTYGELVGNPFHQLMDEQDLAKATVTFDAPSISREAPVTQELRLRHRDSQGADRSFEITVLPIQGDPLRPPVKSADVSLPAHIFGIARDISDRKEAEASMNFHATHDLLTQLPNRTLFGDRLALALTHAKRNNQKLAVMFLDLNRFKIVNDMLGHAVGDLLLQRVARRLKGCLRQGDTLSRFGGDEFTLLLPAMTSKEDATVIAEKLLHSLQQPFLVEGHEVLVGVSIGIAMSPDAGASLDELITHADAAMYVAKRRGDDSYQFYS